jgi:stearoyl-CoA desaturase (delta-9 desaturase)
MDTLRAIMRNRFHVLKLYGRQVVKPVLRSERGLLDGGYRHLYRRLRKWMTREDVRLDNQDEQILSVMLREHQALDTVYQFRQRLKDLWARSASSSALRLQWLQQWCAEAERTGIQALEEFARNLRGYALASR